MFTTYVLLAFLAVLMYLLIRTVVNEIKQYITEETDRVIKAIKDKNYVGRWRRKADYSRIRWSIKYTKWMKRMSEQTINAIINYLVQQPYKDVAGLLPVSYTHLDV